LLDAALHAGPSRLGPDAAPEIPRVRPAASSAALEQILFQRRAIRSYARQPVPFVLARELSILASQFLRERVVLGAPACQARCMLAIARGDSELPSGLYELDAERGELVRRADFDQAALQETTNQQTLGDSPAALIVLGDLEAAGTAHGARGYRNLVQHAGAAVGRAWLAATGYGLGGTAAGGVIAGGLRAVTELDPYRECPLLAFHFGTPAAIGRVEA
jgi:hypothetical protein